MNDIIQLCDPAQQCDSVVCFEPCAVCDQANTYIRLSRIKTMSDVNERADAEYLYHQDQVEFDNMKAERDALMAALIACRSRLVDMLRYSLDVKTLDDLVTWRECLLLSVNPVDRLTAEEELDRLREGIEHARQDLLQIAEWSSDSDRYAHEVLERVQYFAAKEAITLRRVWQEPLKHD